MNVQLIAYSLDRYVGNLTRVTASGVPEQNVTLSSEPALPIEGAFVAGFTVFSLLTMFFYVSVAHIR